MSVALTAAGQASTPARRHLEVWTIALAGLAAFMTALDTLMVITALPVLRASLHASLSGLEWTVNAYNLAFACLLLTGAALGDRFGRRRVFCAGLLVFTAGSTAAALSSTAAALVAARVIQGAGAAIATPLSLTLLVEAFPAQRRGGAIGSWGGIVGTAVGVGPVLGGAVVGGLDWHWMFWLNVPVGAIVIALSWRHLAESRGPRSPLDPIGLILAAVGLLGVTFGLVRANALGWSAPYIVLSITAGTAVLAAFVAWERRSLHPMLPVALFARRGFATANAVSFFMYAGLFGTLF